MTQNLKSQMLSVRNAKHERHAYTVGVFAAMCVVANLLISFLSQLSEADQQNTILFVVLSVTAFFAGSRNAGRKQTEAGNAKVAPAKKLLQTRSAAHEGEREGRQAAKRSVKARGPAAVAPPEVHREAAQPAQKSIQAGGATPAAPPGAEREAAQTLEPQPEVSERLFKAPRFAAKKLVQASGTTAVAPPGVERAASQAARAAEPPPESPEKPVKAQRYASRSSAHAAEATGEPLAGGCQNDPACDAEEKTAAAEVPGVMHTAVAGRTPLRREASTFTPGCWEGPWQMPPPQMSFLYNWVPEGGGDEYTTVILRNLPCSFLRDDLIKEMDAKGWAGRYNFVYVPVDFQRKLSMGYAFVNLVTVEEVPRFMLAFNGFRDWPRPSPKICEVGLSRTQGLDENIRRHRNSPVMSDEVPERFRPVVFDGTERVPFPDF